ncbi:hypothetical protein V6N11_058787 [Hibiscus sabdariffa]|uniref:Uncharacterized protein n=1 Tax=Hibiscus sabdariffa TaxID=183260 RepID=A0ABR2U5A0_9ROSI
MQVVNRKKRALLSKKVSNVDDVTNIGTRGDFDSRYGALARSHELEEAFIVPIATLNLTKDVGIILVPFALARGKESGLVA